MAAAAAAAAAAAVAHAPASVGGDAAAPEARAAPPAPPGAPPPPRAWALCATCPAAVCLPCLLPTPAAAGAADDAGRAAALAAAASASAAAGGASGAASDAGGAWQCAVCVTGRAPSFGALPWCAACSAPLAGPPRPADASFFSCAATAGAAGGVDAAAAWPRTLRCEVCAMGLHGACAARSGAVAGAATLVAPPPDDGAPAAAAAAAALREISAPRAVFVCGPCRAAAGGGGGGDAAADAADAAAPPATLILSAPLAAMSADGAPSLAASMPLLLAHAPTREIIVVAKVL
jgi:hypothetical protein